MKVAPITSEEDERRALEAVLASETFARSDKLKHFLRHICELKIAGRSAEINEHTIGVEALGRPPNYSTGDDSIVRSTAYVLRQKLMELYEKELPDANLRIELHKGSYVPVFVSGHDKPEPVPEPVITAFTARRIGYTWVFAAGFGTAALLVLVTFLLLRSPGVERLDSIVAEAWGPLASPGSRVMIFIGHPPHFLVRQYKPGDEPTDEVSLPLPEQAYTWYRGLQPMEPGNRLFSYATGNSCLLGDAFAAVLGAQTLSRLGVSYQVVPERTVRLPGLRGTNVLLFGNPEYSPAIATLLANGAYSIAFDAASKHDGITDKRTSRTYVPKLSPKNRVGEAYGLITVLTQSENKDAPHRAVVFSGVNSAGTHAAMEYFSSPEHLKQLKQRFAGEGQSGFPASYQVLIKSSTETSVPISFSYESHRILNF